MVGPKPIMYRVTRTLNSFAGSRWPTSCKAMETAMPTATKTTPPMKSNTVTIYFLLSVILCTGGQQLLGPGACPHFSIQH